MPERKIGISADVKQGAGFDRLLKNFRDVEKTAQELESRFQQMDRTVGNLTKRGFGSSAYTREMEQQLRILQQYTRLTEANARRTNNPGVQEDMAALRGRISTTMGDLGAVQPRMSMRDVAKFGAQAALTSLGFKAVSMFGQGYGAAYGMLPSLANFSQTMASSVAGATNSWAYKMLASAQGYGYTNSDILGGAQELQGAMGRSSLFNNYMRGIAQFGRYNGFDFRQAAGYFSSDYQAGGHLSPIQYATLVAQTVNQANMQGRNAQVVQSLQQMSQTVSQTMTGLSNGAQTGVASMFATVGKTGNQALINQFPSIFNAMNSSITSGTSLGPLGQAAQWKAIAPGMNYWQAQYLASQGAMGKGPNGQANWINKLKYAYNQFGGNSYEDYVMGGSFMGISPTQMHAMLNTFMPNGTFNESAVTTKAGKHLLGLLKGGSMSSLDKTVNNFHQAKNNEQHAASKMLGPMSQIDKWLGKYPYASASLGLVAGGLAGHGLLGTLLGRSGMFSGMFGGGGGAAAGESLLSRVGRFFGMAGKDAGGVMTDLGGSTGVLAKAGDALAPLAGLFEGIGGAQIGNSLGKATFGPIFKGYKQTHHSLFGDTLYNAQKGLTVHNFMGMQWMTHSTPSSTDYAKKAQDSVNTLMAMRPWAHQINSWFGVSPTAHASYASVVPAKIANAKAVAQISGQFSQAGLGAPTLSGPAAPVSSGYTGTGNQQFIHTMTPYALQAATGMGVPAQYRNNVAKFLIAQWSKESGFGTSVAAHKNDNFAGIEPPGSGHFAGVDPKYAGYSSLSSFANGVAYWYTKNSYYSSVLDAARKGASPAELARLVGQTPYAGGAKGYGTSIANSFLPIVDRYYNGKSATQTVKVQMPKTVRFHIVGANGQTVASSLVHLTTTATMNGQKQYDAGGYLGVAHAALG